MNADKVEMDTHMHSLLPLILSGRTKKSLPPSKVVSSAAGLAAPLPNTTHAHYHQYTTYSRVEGSLNSQRLTW